MKIKLMSNNQEYIIEKLEFLLQNQMILKSLNSGEIGFIITGIKIFI